MCTVREREREESSERETPVHGGVYTDPLQILKRSVYPNVYERAYRILVHRTSIFYKAKMGYQP